MSQALSISMGCFWNWDDSPNTNSLLKFVKKLDVDGVELHFRGDNGLFNFQLSSSNQAWIKNLKCVTIHAPSFSSPVKNQLDKLNQIYNDVNASNIVFHPDQLPSWDLMKDYDFNASIENLRPKANVSVNDLLNTFKVYKDYGLCLDICHAYFYSKSETKRLINLFRNQIVEIHLSGTYKRRDHQPLLEVTDVFLESIKPVRNLKVPIIIEDNFTGKDLSFVKKEIKFIKKFLKYKRFINNSS